MLAAALATGIGIWMIVPGFHRTAAADQRKALTALIERCQNEIQPRFKEVVRCDVEIAGLRALATASANHAAPYGEFRMSLFVLDGYFHSRRAYDQALAPAARSA